MKRYITFSTYQGILFNCNYILIMLKILSLTYYSHVVAYSALDLNQCTQSDNERASYHKERDEGNPMDNFIPLGFVGIFGTLA